LQFGKNRVQYQPFLWNYFDFSNYKVYFYMGGDKIARYVGDRAKSDIAQISQFMDYQLQSSIDFIVYNKESEYAQSNIGLSEGEQYNIGGTNKIVGHKVILYFEGDHEKLNEQIRIGIAQVMFNEMMYGGSVTNVLRSSALLNIPPWFEQGFVYYVANGWTTEIDNHIRDGIESGHYKKFNHLSGMEATYAGVSLWNYIAQTYGETVMPNVLYLARTTRSIESAFLFVLGTNLKGLTSDWLSFYTAEYQKDKSAMVIPKAAALLKKPKNNRTYYQLHASPDGKYIVYSTNEMGQMKVWLYDLQTHKRKKLFKQGHKINRVLDYSYPLMAWHPTSQLFSIILEEKGKLMLYTYTISDHKLEGRRIVNFSKILSFSYADDGTKFVMSAVQDGQSDLYIFTAASNAFEQLTHDVYDDLTPRFVDHSRKIIFSSNRPDDTLRLGGDYKKMQTHTDIFEYDYATHSNILRRITNTPDADETSPMAYANGYVSYLSDESGVRNRYIAHVDSTISFIDTAAHYRYIVNSFPITDYARNINEQDITNTGQNYTQIIYYKGKYWMYNDTLASTPGSFTPTLLYNTTFMATKLAAIKKKKRDDSLAVVAKNDTSRNLLVRIPPAILPQSVINNVPKDSTQKTKRPDSVKTINPAHIPVNINDYSFDENIHTYTPPPSTYVQQPVTVQPLIKKPVAIVTDTAKHDSSHTRKKVLERNDYHVSFIPEYVLTQLSNSFTNTSYQPYIGYPQYQEPGFGASVGVGLADLFEDYRLDGGVRMAVDLSTNEYFLSYSDNSERLDKQLILHREALLGTDENGYAAKDYIHDATYLLKWPFSEVARVEGSAAIIEQKTVELASDVPSLEQDNKYAIVPKAEIAYVYDATLPVELNIEYGFKARVFAQYYKDVSIPNANTYIFGFDGRYYQKISRDLIWANRIAGGTSLGQEKLLYYLGGEDGWIGAQFDNNISVSPADNYAYQTLAVPMRGFQENIRNGNDFVVFNSEIRWPIFHYLFNRPIKSDFFNNFQVIGFFDAGTAWTGPTPYSNENALNETVVSTPGNPITVTLSTLQDPFVEGMGYGLRTRIFGYFIRFDDAWGISNGTIAKTPVTYFSLSLDF
jgi:Tol biopolymer transport system component